MTQAQQPIEIGDLTPPTPREGDFRRRYDPLGTCPTPLRDRYEKLALKAASGSLAAIARLKCLECCAWQPVEVRRCEISGCALWLRARRHEVRK